MARLIAVIVSFAGFMELSLGEIVYVEPHKPYRSAPFLRQARAGNVDLSRGVVNIPLITWAADGVTVSSNGGMSPSAGSKLAKRMGAQAKLELIDDFDKQVANYISGRSPFLRGTMGMINLVAGALKAIGPGLEPIVVFQLSWSTGADGFVAKGVAKLPDLKGKTIVVQLNGPHVDLVQVLLQDAGLTPGDVRFKYVREITYNPDAAKDGKVHDPANAFRKDPSLAGAACIFPDILTLTAGGKVGTGAEDSVRGARPILSTRTASRVIADVYAVRRDFFQSHRELVHGFVVAQLQEQDFFAQHLANISRKANADQSKVKAFKALCKPLAGIFLQDEGAVNDYVLWVGVDSRLAGYAGNVEFFTDPKNPIGFRPTCARVQGYYRQVGYVQTETQLSHANWDYPRELGQLVSKAEAKVAIRQTFSSAQQVRKAAESADANELFRYTFKFPAKMAELDWRDFKDVFQTMHEKVTRYGGAIVQLRGHADNFFYNFVTMKRRKGDTTYRRRIAGTNQFKQFSLPTAEEVVNSANKLSYSRAFAVKRAYARYLREAQNMTPEEMDLSRFDVKGMGVSDPIHANPTTREQCAANMRGEMVIIAVEAEIPLDFGMDDLQ